MPRIFCAMAFLSITLLASLHTQAVVLVEDGQAKMPVIIDKDAPPATRDAAMELVNYLNKISSADVQLVVGAPDSTSSGAIWVGVQPGLESMFPELKLSFEQPEEILIAVNEKDLLIAGRDVLRSNSQAEYGTANAVYTFLQKYLNVRWLWPGELGEDIQPQKTIALPPTVYRFAPPIRQRKLHYPPTVTEPAGTNQWWMMRLRGRDSLPTPESHSFNDWWDRYYKTHPEYFALQPNGRRTVENPILAKLCVSNPAVAEQWLDNAQKTLEQDPTLTLIGATPNDGGGWCVCDNCKAWDHPDAPKGVLTDRYVHFWNVLARGLKERFPERNVMLSVLAYSRNRTPPIGIKLENNICVGYVGAFPITYQSDREKQKTSWLKWAEQATLMRYRPNLFWYSGGVWGFPTYEPTKTIEDFRFLADHGSIGLEIDSGFMNWSTLGPQLYLIAQLSYDPTQDGTALMAEYFTRGFGPAASDVQHYFSLMEKAHQSIVETQGHFNGGVNRYKVLDVIVKAYDDELMAEAQKSLDAAAASVEQASPHYQQRVAFIRTGMEFVKLQRKIIEAMKVVRISGAQEEAVANAAALCDERDALAAAAPRYAIDYKRILSQINLRKMEDYLGPPSEELRQLAHDGPVVRYAPPKWALTFEDDFDRSSLGENWSIKDPQHLQIKDGDLIVHRDTLFTTKAYPGLHRLELEVTGLPDDQGRYGDLSPFIHASSDDISTGYFMQFGGIFNTFNSIRRLGRPMVDDGTHTIKPDVRYRIIAEFNGTYVRLSVNNRTILRQVDPRPLVGEDHERMGVYIWSGARIHRIRILTAPAVPLPPMSEDPDIE